MAGKIFLLPVVGYFMINLLPMTYAQSKDGDIRLVGGSYQWEGRVEIYFSGTWGTITDSDWTSNDAQAVCRKMGYFKPGASQHRGGYFGAGSGPIHLDHVVCSGTEYSFTDCEIENNTRQSSHSEDVGVKCQTINSSYQEGDLRLVEGSYNWEGRVEIFLSGTWSTIKDKSWTDADATVVCNQLGFISDGAMCKSGDIRLVGGSSDMEGRVEICFGGIWGTICDDYWDDIDALVVCRQLGFPSSSATAYHSASFGRGRGPIFLDDVMCSGNENSLQQCRHEGVGDHDCEHSNDAGVACIEFNVTMPCPIGKIRLAGGNGIEGRVEVCFNGIWGTVCDDGWDNDDARVVCSQLGLPSSSPTAYGNAHYGAGTGPIHLDDVRCSGNEETLQECLHNGLGFHNCQHSNDASVSCTNGIPRYYSGGSGLIQVESVNCLGSETNITACPHSTANTSDHSYDVGVKCQRGGDYREGDIRLVGGDYSWEGRVEIYLRGEWGTIHNNYYMDYYNAHVVCRQLGYDTQYGFADISRCCSAFGDGTGPIHMNYLECTGTEYRLFDCTHRYDNKWYYHYDPGFYFFHYDDWSVICNNDGPNSGEVRLYYDELFPSYYKGRVEVFKSETWGTVAGDWSLKDSAVVCRQLGFEISSEVISLSSNYADFNREIVPMHMSNVQCVGTESRLTLCPHDQTSKGSGIVATQECIYYLDSKYQCRIGETRLVGGGTDMEGRVELCTSFSRWGTVCNKQWTPSHTKVVCRQLGYSDTGGFQETSHTYGEGAYPILMDYVNCTGSEIRLWDCIHFTHSYSGCTHSQDVGVHCQPAECNDGDVRLLETERWYLKHVDMCLTKRWVPVCRNNWNDAASSVVCRQLGYYRGYMQYTWIPNLSVSLSITVQSCTGTEFRLSDCIYSTVENYDGCVYPAATYCFPDSCVDGELRLSEGETEWEGRLEMCSSRRWGTVGSEGWSQENSKVVCNDLGYELNTETYSPRPATKSMPAYISNVHCSGEELTLLDCSYSGNLSSNDHSKDIGIRCEMVSCDDGDLRLIGGGTEYEGLLEVCFSLRWGTVNGDGWSDSDTQVACRQLGIDAVGTQSSYRQLGILSSPIHMDNVACYGSEEELIDCTYHTDTGEDEHTDDIWINCNTITTTEQAMDKVSESTAPTNTIALVVSLVGLAIIIVVVGLLTSRKVYKHKCKSGTTNHSVYFNTDGEGSAVVIMDEQEYEKPPITMEDNSHYPPVTMSSVQGSNPYSNVSHGGGDKVSLPPNFVTDSGDYYDTCS